SPVTPHFFSSRTQDSALATHSHAFRHSRRTKGATSGEGELWACPSQSKSCPTRTPRTPVSPISVRWPPKSKLLHALPSPLMALTHSCTCPTFRGSVIGMSFVASWSVMSLSPESSLSLISAPLFQGLVQMIPFSPTMRQPCSGGL